MNYLLIKRKNLLLMALFIIFLFLISFFCIFEFTSMERVVLPTLIYSIIASIIFVLINILHKDKFVSKIFVISILIHFIFILFWQILKYYILGLSLPSLYSFSAFISDRDAGGYHLNGVYIANNFFSSTFSYHFKGGLFPKLVGVFYHYFTANPIIVCLFNAILGSFTSCIVYLIGKSVLRYDLTKIYSVLCAISTSFIVNTSIMIRDCEIMFFTYLSIYLVNKFFNNKNLLYLLLSCFSIFLLYSFRAYAAFCLIGAIALAFIVSNIKYKKSKNGIRINKLTLILIILFPVIIVSLFFITKLFVSLIGYLSIEELLALRESGYTGTESDYPWTFDSLYSIFPLLPIIVGYLCFLFSPFPYEWCMIKRLHYVPDTMILYLFLSSFFKNIKKIVLHKYFILLVCLFTMIIQFGIYSITVANSGTVFRLRGPFIPMIYLIAMYQPDKFLSRILNKIQKWRLV